MATTDRILAPTELETTHRISLSALAGAEGQGASSQSGVRINLVLMEPSMAERCDRPGFCPFTGPGTGAISVL